MSNQQNEVEMSASRKEKDRVRQIRELSAAISRSERQIERLRQQADHAQQVRRDREAKISRRIERQRKQLAELEAA